MAAWRSCRRPIVRYRRRRRPISVAGRAAPLRAGHRISRPITAAAIGIEQILRRTAGIPPWARRHSNHRKVHKPRSGSPRTTILHEGKSVSQSVRSVMSFHRVVLVALATLFSVGMTSIASAGCCGWGYSAPVAYATVAPVGYGGCGGAAATAAAVFAAPVAPAPIAVGRAHPIAASLRLHRCADGFGGPCCSWNGCGNCGWSDWSGCGGWGGGWRLRRCGNCGGCGRCGSSSCAPPLYVVNQGPDYSGPGIMSRTRPIRRTQPTRRPPTILMCRAPGYGYGYGAVPAYAPYYRHPYYRPRFAYRSADGDAPHHASALLRPGAALAALSVMRFSVN